MSDRADKERPPKRRLTDSTDWVREGEGMGDWK